MKPKCHVFDRCSWARLGRGKLEEMSLGPLMRLIPEGWSNRRSVPGLPLWLGLSPGADTFHSVPFHYRGWGQVSLHPRDADLSLEAVVPNCLGLMDIPEKLNIFQGATGPCRQWEDLTCLLGWSGLYFSILLLLFRSIHRAGLSQNDNWQRYIYDFPSWIKKFLCGKEIWPV